MGEDGPLAAARRIGLVAAPRSTEIEANRTLPRDLVDALVDAGLMRLLVPSALGGEELDVAPAIAVTEELGYHDGATAWCQMIAMTTGLAAGLLPVEHAVAIYGRDDAVTGGLAAPMGRAEAVDGGGVRVSGHWQWGSGTAHCTMIGGGAIFPDGKVRFPFMDPADVTLLDTWRVSGLKGTGSTDYTVDGAFVPEGRWVRLGGATPTSDGPLYRFSFFGLLAVGIASVALGLARRSIDELVELAAVKRPQGSSRPLSERSPVQADVANAEATLRAARALIDDAVGGAWDTVLAGDPSPTEERWLVRLAATHAVTESARVVDVMYEAGGGASVYDDSALQRVFRDVHVATQHAMVAPRTMELLGRIRLGLDTELGQL
jgi:alkylation response protein AidB-like acyl-CoA dehydrogenase